MHCPRPWGRVGETFGEDPMLIGRFASALVRGLQGPNGVSDDQDKVLACVKHFAGYSETVGGRDASEAKVGLGPKQLKFFSAIFRNLELFCADHTDKPPIAR
jgi:beta-glucosidase